MNAINSSLDETSAILVSGNRVNVCTFGKISGCSAVIANLSAAREIAIRAKFRRLASVTTNADRRAEVSNIVNFLQIDLDMSMEDVQCIFAHYAA